MIIKKTTSQRIFTILNYTFFALLTVAMIFPFWNILMMSFSEPIAAQRGGIFLAPRNATIQTYQSVFKNQMIFTGFGTSIFVTGLGTFIGLALTAMAAFALSKSRLRGGSMILYLILFTMLFNGGMIPNYMLIRNLGLLDNRWALILPNLVNAYNLIIMRNFFLGLPPSLEESARIDGANDARVFFQIVLPLSKASLATIGLFIAVGYWNDYFSTVIYITSTEKWSLQAVLRFLLTNTQQAMAQAGVSTTAGITVTAQTIKAASIIVTTVPILIIYPFVQKYFVTGVTLGGVKG